ncbi:SHD1 domain-containing protein [Novipirellula sp.]|uniref:SHD1 domain-containing protein n=1 Tax=Novipirellula sp. TaxID=2795430 RepID=UPI003567E692
MDNSKTLLPTLLCMLLSISTVHGQHQLHEIAPPDPDALYATLGFCGFSGISVDDLKTIALNDEDLAETVKAMRSLRSRDGVIVTNVLSGSAAELSGLKPFDVINNVNGTHVATFEEAATEFAQVTPPSKVKCRIQRSGQRGTRVFWRANQVDLSTTSYLTFCILATDTDRDEVEKTTIVSHKDEPSRWLNSYVALQAVQIRDKPAVLRLTFNYSSDDWLFVSGVNLVTDDERLDFSFTSPTRDNDVVSGRHRLYERESFVLDEGQIATIRNIISRRDTGTIRYTGQTYRKDVAFGSSTLERMKVVFDRWAISTGNPTITQLVEPPPRDKEPANEIPEPALRTFVDKSGKFSIKAVFLGVKNDKVGLKKMDGEVVSIPLTSLSDNDQDWVKSNETSDP